MPANSVGTRQLKKGAVTTSKIAASAMSPIAWARIAADGTVVAGRGITAANVTKNSVAGYCFHRLGFKFGSAAVTVDYGGIGVSTETVGFGIGDPYHDCPSLPKTQAEVATMINFSYSPAPFFVQFFS